MSVDPIVEYASEATLTAAPQAAREAVRDRVLDTLAATTAGFRFRGGAVVREYARRFGPGRAPGEDRSAGDGRASNGGRPSGASGATVLDGSGDTLAVEGAVLANATAANVLDVDDGHRLVKGHPAAVVIPTALATAEAEDATVGELLDAVLVGYELGVRAGLAIHETDGVYTGTGSWGALGAAAAVARIRGLEADAFADALSVAEYHAPRTPIMRGVERPGMTKDGIGWGAYVGATAVDLAEEGFTGSGTVFDSGGPGAIDSLGDRYHVTEAYLKPYPCCRWAQPGVDAVLDLRDRHEIAHEDVERVVVDTFEEATHLATRRPGSAEAAEYSYPYPVAAALVRGGFTPGELTAESRADPAIQRVADRVELRRDDEIDARFPEECLARVAVETGDESYASEITRPRGSVERPLPRPERRRKARELFEPTVGAEAVEETATVLSARSRPVTALLSPWRE